MDLTPYLGWIVFLHVVSLFLFAAGHGVSLFVAFRVKGERDPARLLALLDLSGWSLNLAFIGLLGVLLFGIIAGIVAGDFGHLWLWTSIVVFLVIGGAMTPLGAIPLNKIRLALGQPLARAKLDAPPVALPMDQVTPMLAALRPDLLAAIGGGGFVVILYLMMFKPF